ncbi:PEP-CTERM sorting domain-containing protein [Colwellia sp. PAMC 20917]|uniref:PEP-CTERM sorting domain-containing protein n=1 Tax=Colwellia sp. PAMC 20917 TaxID=1816218 RepID=UPI003FA45D2A
MAGHSSQTNSNWVANGVSSPFAEYSFYAASSVVEKIRVDVPEPGTLIMLSLGLAGLSFSRYRKQS